MRHGSIRQLPRFVFAGITLMLVAASLSAGVPDALANTITVNTLSDSSVSGDGQCSLREAITNANAGSDTTLGDCAAGSGNDTINFSVSGTIATVSTLPLVADTLTIDGTGQTVIINGGGTHQIIGNSGTLSVLNLTFANGKHYSDGGAIQNGGAGSLTATNCTFSTNQGFFGGAIANYTGSVTINNSAFQGNSATNVSGGAIYNGGTLTIDGSTFSGSWAPSRGGAIINLGTVAVTNSSFSGNNAGQGSGAIENASGGTLTISNSTLSSNGASANGGAISNGGIATITDSTLSNNTSSGFGAGIYSAGTLTVTGSTFSGNRTTNNYAGAGGGIYSSGTLSIANSTFAGNTAATDGGAVIADWNSSSVGSTATVTNSTFSGNSAIVGGCRGGGICSTHGSVTTVRNSAFADNTGGNCETVCNGCGGVSGTISNDGYNVSTDGTCGFGSSLAANGLTIGDNVDPLLSPAGLQNNGGPTETIALQNSSPAVDAIPIADCPATDQRGVARPDTEDVNTSSQVCDIGAFELAFPTSATGTTIDFGLAGNQSDSPAGMNVTMGAFVHDQATISTAVNPIPDGSTATFNVYANNACLGTPSSTDTVAVPAGSMMETVESSGTTGVAALGPLQVGALSYNAAFTSGDTGQIPDSTSTCEPLNVGSSISQFLYYLDANLANPYSCTAESLINNVCTSGQEATVTVGSTHGYQVNVLVTNNTGLPITEKVQGGLASGKGVSYSAITVTPGCGAASFNTGKNGNVVIWNQNGSTSTSSPGFPMAPGAVCELQITVTKKFGSAGQQTITGKWSESQIETSPVTGKTITMTSPYTGSLVVDVTP